MQIVQKYFMSLILSYKVRNNIAWLRCIANQVHTGHKLNLSPGIEHKLIHSNQQQIWMWHGCGVMQTVWKCFIPFIISYKARKKTDLLRCTSNQAGTGHKLHFQPRTQARAKLAEINNKNGCGKAELSCRMFISVSYN